MQESKHADAIKETMRTIDEALKGKNILDFQRRLASMLSVGLQHLVELYLHRLYVIKPGAFVKHEWFLMGDKNLKAKFSAILTQPYEEIENINEIASLARDIEGDRNELLYGSPIGDENRLKEKIGSFLETKKIVEKTGDIIES